MAGLEEKIRVIGEGESIAGFPALGLEVAPVQDTQAAQKVLEAWAADGFAVIFLTEKLAQEMGPELASWRLRYLPVVTVIPSARQAPWLGRQELRTAIRKATGIDMIGQRDKARQQAQE